MLNRKNLLEQFNIYDILISNKSYNASDADFYYHILLDEKLCLDLEFEFIITELSRDNFQDFLTIYRLARKLN